MTPNGGKNQLMQKRSCTKGELNANINECSVFSLTMLCINEMDNKLLLKSNQINLWSREKRKIEFFVAPIKLVLRVEINFFA